MVSDGTEFAVGNMERLLEEARRNTKAKHEKWEKYYNRRRRDVQIKVNDWVLIAIRPLSSATRKVIARFKPKFEGPYKVLDVINNNVVTKRRKRSGVPTIHREEDTTGRTSSIQKRHRTTTPTSKSEHDQATRMPNEEAINNGRTKKGKERVREGHYP
ncbi:uncharacterized protein TNCV_1411281 [Trichonephila clavipes]|nr:uncharacterized protein TNCV_1411281 [Trichonephila clavipes]